MNRVPTIASLVPKAGIQLGDGPAARAIDHTANGFVNWINSPELAESVLARGGRSGGSGGPLLADAEFGQ